MSIGTEFFRSGFVSYDNYKRFEYQPYTAAADEIKEQVSEIIDKMIAINSELDRPEIDRKVLVSRIICKLTEVTQ